MDFNLTVEEFKKYSDPFDYKIRMYGIVAIRLRRGMYSWDEAQAMWTKIEKFILEQK